MGCKYNLMYHIILVTKYRKRLLITYGDFIKKCVEEISLKYRFNIECMEVDKDHIHLLIKTKPSQTPSFIVSLIKQITTFKLYQEYREELKTIFYKKDIFWSSGYFINTIGNASEETIKEYIKNQG